MTSQGCSRCGNRHGHGTLLAEAACAYRHAATAAVRDHARSVGADPQHAAELVAHLRGLHSDERAVEVVRYVLDLGWRKAVP